MFVQGGGVYPGDSLDDAGSFGIYWSSVGRNSSSAYLLDFYLGRVYPSSSDSRYRGYSVRCVALGGWAQYVMLCLFFIG